MAITNTRSARWNDCRAIKHPQSNSFFSINNFQTKNHRTAICKSGQTQAKLLGLSLFTMNDSSKLSMIVERPIKIAHCIACGINNIILHRSIPNIMSIFTFFSFMQGHPWKQIPSMKWMMPKVTQGLVHLIHDLVSSYTIHMLDLQERARRVMISRMEAKINTSHRLGDVTCIETCCIE